MSAFSIEPAASSQIEVTLDRDASRIKQVTNQLASGLRVNSSADDPSGYAVGTTLQGQAQATDTAGRNTTVANDVSQVSLGAIGTLISVVQRISTLSVEANSDVNSPQDLVDIQTEVLALLNQISHIASTTEYNGIPLFGNGGRSVPQVIQTYTTGSSGNAAAESVTFNLAQPPTVGNLLLASIGYGNNFGGGDPPPTLTTPPGWTLVTSQDNSLDNGLSVYQKIAGPAEPLSYAFTVSPGDVESGTFEEIANATTTGLTSSIQVTFPPGVASTPSLTASVSNVLPLAVQEINGFAGAPGTPTGINGFFSVGSAFQNYHSLEVEAAPPLTAGASTQESYDWGGDFGPGEAALILVEPTETSLSPLEIATAANEGSVQFIDRPAVDSASLGLNGIDVTIPAATNINPSGADLAEQASSLALSSLTTIAAKIGSEQIAISSSGTFDATLTTNLTQSSSSILDTNIAAASVALTKDKVIINIGTSLLAQTNASAANVLQLFKPAPTGSINFVA